MKKKRIMSCIMALLLIVLQLAPAAAYAASTKVTIKIEKDGLPDDSYGKGWDIGYDGNMEDKGIILESGYTFTFTGYTCELDIFNYGIIADGDFSGYVINNEDAEIKDGSFTGSLENSGTISGGTFSGSNLSNYEDGLISGGSFKRSVDNEGKITGGSFKGFTNYEDASIKGGSFSGSGENYGVISKGTFSGTVKNFSTITGGTFLGNVTNGDAKKTEYEEASIKGATVGSEDSDGEFEFTNYAIITSGEYFVPVVNYNTIKGGTFHSTVKLEDSKLYELNVSGGTYSQIENNSDDYDLDADECEFVITAIVRGTGEALVNESAYPGDTVTLLTAPGAKVKLDSILVYDSDEDKVKVKKQSENYYTFTMPESAVVVEVIYDDYDEDAEDISQVKLYMDALEVDEYLPDAENVSSFSSARPDYKVTRTEWFLDDEEFDDYACEGDAYTVTITVVPENGYSFTPEKKDMTVTLNGEKCSIDSLSVSKLVCSYSFDELDEDGHVHSYSGKYTSKYHWRECSCGSVIEKAEHSFGKDGKCTVCGYYNENYDKSKDLPFTDVKSSAYYYDAVKWAYFENPQVTDGTDATHFSPSAKCTRGQVVTFLWRAAGKPSHKSSSNPFTDVKTSDYYYDAVLWAYEKGITDGVTKTQFGPGQTCSNAHILTFIWRAMGSPDKDANAESWYTDAYYWAKYNGLLKGSYSGTYDLKGDSTRANVIYYLYQYDNLAK